MLRDRLRVTPVPRLSRVIESGPSTDRRPSSRSRVASPNATNTGTASPARRHEDPAACEAELCRPKGRAWLMRWLPSRAHDNGMFLLFSNGIGPDDDEIRTGNAMVLDPYGEVIAESRALGDDMVVADLDASVLPTSSGRRWLRARRPELYESLARPTGQELETRRERFGE